MSTKPLPIIGYPHLALAAQEDGALFARTTEGLRMTGFKIHPDHVVPPESFDGRQIITAITAAFQKARNR
ncbi:hypothetical protein [Hyphomicrobium sp.]|jgi:hypothetical protein|uniref:hypothetical protein n=1 Tax=Hyphomicrobium sp. TaxID=82 RepID=UPI003569F343